MTEGPIDTSTSRLGDWFSRPPVPADPDRTQMFDAGAVSIGVEYRMLTTEIIERSYAGAVQLEADDRGVSVHVFDSSTRIEHLRFDDFDDDKHYHYIRSDGTHLRVGFDAAAQGPMIPWALGCVRQRLAEMLTFAGADGAAQRLDQSVINPVLDAVLTAARLAEQPAGSGSS